MAEQSQNPGAVTNTFTKGMVKDYNDTFVGEGLWTHARNAVNNSHDGQVGVIGNEPANLKCITLPYPLIGYVHLSDDQWVVFTTNDVDSEIGIFDESACTYTKVVNDRCLNFKRSHLITGASRRKFDCNRLVYWSDGLNPDRFMDVFEPPFKYTEQIVDGCAIKTIIEPRQLDCELIRLAPLMVQPCLTLSKGKTAGTLPNGSYQAAIAYTINGARVTDYIGLSEVQSLFSHENLTGSLELVVNTVDKEFDEFELVIISNVNQQTVARRVGIYSTNQGTIYIDTLSPELITVPLSGVLLRSEPIERSDAIYRVNDYLLKVGIYSKYKFNYQQQANKIITRWTAVEYPADYYFKGGNNVGYMRDEQYSFFIRWVYNTGERSESYHIPGREATAAERQFDLGTDAYETSLGVSPERWQVQNTGSVTSITRTILSDGGIVVASGQMAYWESTERYPDNKPEIWGDLCGKPIRHHKFPDETVSTVLNTNNNDGKNIVLLGVQFENISIPVDQNGNVITSIIGYEILRGSREGQKSIIAKGLFNNLREYYIPGNNDVRGLYQNYPYNDLSPDNYLTFNPQIVFPDDPNIASLLPVTSNPNENQNWIDAADNENPEDDDKVKDNAKSRRRESSAKLKQLREQLKNGFSDLEESDADALFIYKRNYLSFHSPETTFTRPFLGVSEVKIYQEIHGKAFGLFDYPYKHPKFKTVTNFSGYFSSVLATIVGIGNILSVFACDGNMTLPGTDKLSYQKKLTLCKMPNFPVGGGGQFLGTGGNVTFPNPFIAISNAIVGTYNLTMAIAMSYIEADIVGEQILNVIYGMIPKRQNALQYMSHGFYNQGLPTSEGDRRFQVVNASYVDEGIQGFDPDYSINNVYRSNFVAVNIHRDKNDPTVVDGSRFRIGAAYEKIRQVVRSTISGHYGALKVTVPAQYGQIDQIKQVPVSTCVHRVDSSMSKDKYFTGVLFNGDTYINRFTEKNTMYFFNEWLFGEPDEYEFDYRNHINVAYPRFWINSERQDFKLFKPVSMYRHLDKRKSSLFFVNQGYFYLFNSGVRDFFVESEINLAYRDWEDLIAKRHYDPYRFTDYQIMFRSDNIRNNNFYKYDYSLSVSKLFHNYVSYGTVLPRYYDPVKFATCFTYRPSRVNYSLPQEEEGVKDNWRIYLANNFREFGSPVTAIKTINRTGALFMMRRQSPVQFTGVDQLQTDAGTKITVGDGGLFQQPLQNLVNTDASYEYGSCQSKYATISTIHGVFWVSQDQGKVFQYAGQLNEISREGMKWWFANYLPSNLLKVYPDYPLHDNPVRGVGVQMIYDNTNEIIYITKKDYVPLDTNLVYDNDGNFFVIRNGVRTRVNLTDTQYFTPAHWTISYDPKNKMWISFHDWIPTFLIPGKAHFMSVNTDSIWKHNVRCDQYANFYGVSHPFEVEFVSSTGQTVTSTRNVEYLLEVYQHHNSCADKFHVLDANFDMAMVYNSEQISGLLQLELKDKANPLTLLNYPQIRNQSIGIQYSKEEHKYRFNQFWDITRDRGEFNNVNVPMFLTAPNGYEYQANPQYINYNKAVLERKKFRHTYNRVWLRKMNSGSQKFLFKMINTKMLQSPR